MVGIIDIGTNTIRMVMYENEKIVSNTALRSEILKDTENGMLTQTGTQKLVEILQFFKEKAGENKLFVFATYAFRELKNKEDVKEKILKETGINIDILTGSDEAECDFLSIRKSLTYEESGIGIDLGGGSAQIFSFSNKILGTHNSYPIGCNLIQKKLGFGAVPEIGDIKRSEEYIEEEINTLKDKSDKLYIMGGSAKCAAIILKKMYNKDTFKVDLETLDEIYEYVEKTPEHMVRELIGNRYENILTGLIIIKKVAKTVGAEKIIIKSVSVREGYMIKNSIM